jgi:hypothetical protein
MSDAAYSSQNMILKSRGVIAHNVVDSPPGESYYLQLESLEEIEENGLATRLGTIINSKIGSTAYPITGVIPYSLSSAPTTAVNQGSYAGGAWQTPAYAIGTNPLNVATVHATSPGIPLSDQLLASGIAPTIPASATILGFVVTLFAGYQRISLFGTPTLNVSLALSGSPVGTAKAFVPANNSLFGANHFYSFGSSADLWGYGGWTTAQIIANLGIILQASATSATNGVIGVYGLKITFYYSIATKTIHSLQKLAGLNGQAWRYAGVGTTLFRLQGLNPGTYLPISTSLSGQPWGSAVYSPTVTAVPYLYMADFSGMLKDNGSLVAPQNMGIFQPTYPVLAQAQEPDEIILDPFTGSSYTTANVGTFTPDTPVLSTTTTAAITATGIQAVPVAATPNPIGLFQSLVIDTAGSAETVLVLQVTATGFVANFTKTHLTGVAVVEQGATGTVDVSTTATVSQTFSGTPISAWPTTLEQEDYIGLWLYIGDPNAIQSITLQFNTANGAYFYRTIGQGPLQSTLNAQTDASTAAADAIIGDTLGLYTAGAGGVTGLSTVPGWTPILLQLSDFSGAGGADFNDPVMNWDNVTGYQVTIVTGTGIATTSFPVTFEIGSLILFGGAGPDSFAGVGYDYMFTFFNPVDFTESNPSMAMTNVNPPSLTNWVVPRRQPVLLTITNSTTDPQATYIRIYRRGGTLADNYRRIDEVPLTAATGATQTYLDIWSDLQIQQADTISFTNDVPVTSPLPVPLNNTFSAAINTTNQVATVVFATPLNSSLGGFFQSVFVGQQVILGNVISANSEIVIVLSITTSGINITGFTAYVQNAHAIGEPIAATAKYGQPLNIMAVCFNQGWFAGDSLNPNNLYWTPKGNVQVVSSAAYVPVSNPGDGITAIVGTAGNLFVSTLQRWWSVAPGSNVSSAPTIYPTSVDHGCVGPRAWTLRDGTVFYLGLDGIRTFRGGGGEYISEIIEFVWQNTGPTPIPLADPTQFSSVQVSWWNRWVFFSYIALDGNRHRVILDVDGKRYRTDSLDAESIFLEEDTGTLVWGDSAGLVHLDRQLVAYDEEDVSGAVVQAPIAITLQTPYGDQGAPQTQKNYAEFTGDFNTNGRTVIVQLLFDNGGLQETIGSVTTTFRQKVNLALNGGAGYQAYNVSMLLTTATGGGIDRIFLYQAKIRHILLGETRTSYDSYDLRMGTDESKILKNIFVETTASAPITCNVYYDGNSTPGYTFTIPEFGGVRNAFRFRLPAVKFRIVRFIFTSDSDFILWETSKFEWKPLKQGSGYSTALLMP